MSGFQKGGIWQMSRIFNVSADCKPNLHYMVNLEDRLIQIKEMVDRGEYFTVNRARQYGKTTLLRALGQYLAQYYVVISLDFQMMSYADFVNEKSFAEAFARELVKKANRNSDIPEDVITGLREVADGSHKDARLADLFGCFINLCGQSEKPVVLIIDEVDSATNNQVFMDFLAQLRGYYIDRDETATFRSVILAGVYDVKNIGHKIGRADEHKNNSPWNIAADFHVDLSFTADEIAGMLRQYEEDHRTGMDVGNMAYLIYSYTSGYPFLVSRLCKIMDEQLAGSVAYPDKTGAWTKAGFLDAVKILLSEKNTLFESLVNKLDDYPQLRKMLYSLLFYGQTIVYNPDDEAISTAVMFGFIKNINGNAVVANRIFETRLYNLFLTAGEMQDSDMYKAAFQDKNQFIQNGYLNMELVLERFIIHFNDLYGDQPEAFREEDGRRYFLLYLRPVINGTGNYYIESQTRNMERTDIIVDYHGEQFVIEMKIWRGNAYHTRGEKQLLDYLEHYHLDKGYILSFNFNKKKQPGMKRIRVGNKILIEAVV